MSMYQNSFLGNMPTCNICYMPYPTFHILGEHIISAHAHQFRPLYDPPSKSKTPPDPSPTSNPSPTTCYSIQGQFGSQFLVKEEPGSEVQIFSTQQVHVQNLNQVKTAFY